MQQNLRVAAIHVCPSQKICTNHLQAVAPGLVRPEHQGRDLDRLLDHRELALINLEIDQLRRLAVLAGQLFLHFPLQLRLGHLPGSVQPGCTFEALALVVPAWPTLGPWPIPPVSAPSARIAMRRIRTKAARAALARAERVARQASIPALTAEATCHQLDLCLH